MPSLRAFFTNMLVPMPLHRKFYLVFRNNFIKIIRRQSCCGHPGEPGAEKLLNYLLVKEEERRSNIWQ